jgi:hypothetical protein
MNIEARIGFFGVQQANLRFPVRRVKRDKPFETNHY